MHALASESNAFECGFRGSFKNIIQAIAEAFKNDGSCLFTLLQVEDKVASKTNEIHGMVQHPPCSLAR